MKNRNIYKENNRNGVNTIKNRLLLIISFMILFLMLFVVPKLIPKKTSEEALRIENNKMKDLSPQTLPSGSETQYDIKLKMDMDGEFQVETTVKIKNTSEDPWEELVFYFIPNIFTEEGSEQLGNPLDVPAIVQVDNVSVEDKHMKFTLDKDTLTIPLESTVQPGDNAEVDFAYQFTLPVGGLRFTKNNENHYLAQFYPMLATYRDHRWNKEEYRLRGETYHTGFSDFTVSYDIPDGYTFVSTSDNEDYPSDRIGTTSISNVKEVFIGILKKPLVIEKWEDNVNIRVFGFEDNEKGFYKEISEIAAESLRYFQKVIGPYPFTQLDVVVDGPGMEYPGIVTVGSIYGDSVSDDAIKNMVVHEIAHQWFYGTISNDPYNDAWLDEGFATFADELFHFSNSSVEVPYDSMLDEIKLIKDASLPVNLSLDQYPNNSHIYGKSSTMLWLLFKNRGVVEEAERFLKTYYDFYKYKEINTEEFVRFAQYYFNLEDTSEFESWLEIGK